MKAQHTPLKDARVVFYGAGSSAVGVATMIAQLISKETGIPFDQAKKVSSLCPAEACHMPTLLRGLEVAYCMCENLQNSFRPPCCELHDGHGL